MGNKKRGLLATAFVDAGTLLAGLAGFNASQTAQLQNEPTSGVSATNQVADNGVSTDVKTPVQKPVSNNKSSSPVTPMPAGLKPRPGNDVSLRPKKFPGGTFKQNKRRGY